MGEVDAILSAAAVCEARDETYALATVVAVRGSSYRRPGARLLVPRDAPPVGIISGGCLEAEAAAIARDALAEETPRLVTIDHSAEGDEVWGSGLGCRGIIDLFVEPADLARETVAAMRAATSGESIVTLTTADGDRRHLAPHEAEALGERAALAVARGRPTLIGDAVLDPHLPPVHLVICGAGPDAEPLASAALRLGWRVTVADPRSRALDPDRFRGAHLNGSAPPDVATEVAADARTVVVVMSHNYLRDAEYLTGFFGRRLAYLGILGPRDRTDRLLRELADNGVTLTDDDRMHLHAPAGLDVGADAPEEVATAVLAEVLAVLHGASGIPLRERPGPIHPD
jgi:xanthine/CO dehydrogenase XdhC/CoxF family maturation factor